MVPRLLAPARAMRSRTCADVIQPSRGRHRTKIYKTKQTRELGDGFSNIVQSFFILAWCLKLVCHRHTAVSTKVVPQKRKSVHDNADWYYG